MKYMWLTFCNSFKSYGLIDASGYIVFVQLIKNPNWFLNVMAKCVLCFYSLNYLLC